MFVPAVRVRSGVSLGTMLTAEPERELLHRLCSGDEAAFAEVVERYHRQLIRLASGFVQGADVAEDVAQETWLAMLKGLDRFEGRSSLRTWLFQICVNRARSVGLRERRTVPVERIQPAVEAQRRRPGGAWTSASAPDRDPFEVEDETAAADTIRDAIGALPQMQRLVVTMRDVDGLTSEQVRRTLAISDVNQRVLLHRGRSHVRRGLDRAGSPTGLGRVPTQPTSHGNASLARTARSHTTTLVTAN
jgi:RNA polymerase sigma-70 factor (ECF subfamily)